MAFEVGSVVAKFVADITGFKNSVKQIQNDTKTLKTGFSDLGKGVSNMAGVFGISLGAAGVVGFLKKSIDAFQESQRVMAQTNSVINSTGKAAGLSAEEIKGMAEEIQKTTAISDDAAQSGMNMLLTFTNIGKDVFPAATQATIDMATAMNNGLTPSAEELSQTAIQVGKALQDPILGVTALRRVGVNFNETQQETIKKMVESGRTMDAQKYILRELGTEFGGSAAAQVQTFGGMVEQARNKIGDWMELVGGSVTPAISSLSGSFGVLASVIGGVVLGALRVLSTAIIGIMALVRMLGIAISTVIAAIMAAVSGDFGSVKQIIVSGFGDMVVAGAESQQKLTQTWGRETSKQTDISKKGFKQQEQASSKKSEKVKKDLADETRKYKEENERRKADFLENLSDMVVAHQDKVKELTEQLSDENKDFNQEMTDRKESFAERMLDMKEAHQEKVDSIVAQIDEETAKGEMADQQKLADLQARLLKENTEYDAKVLKDTQREDQATQRLKEEHEKRVNDTQTQLNAEKAILDAHQAEVNLVKDKAREDDIARLVRQFNEENEKATVEHNRRMTEIAERGSSLGDTLGDNMESGLGAHGPAIKNLGTDFAKGFGDNLKTGIGEGAKKAGEDMIKNFINGIIDKAKNAFNYLRDNGLIDIPVFSYIKDIAKNLPRFATGVNNFSGGLSLVGEKGPELVNLPSGSDVIPNNKLGGTTYQITLDLRGSIVSDDFGAQRLSEKVGDSIVKKLQANVRF